MNQRNPKKPQLTEGQQKLVEDNLGLVRLHLRRRVPNLARPRRDREWDDLFQEGCLGLMQAAASHDANSGIPFASYALARIHGAIHQALRTRFSTIAAPARRRRRVEDRRDVEAGFRNPRDHRPEGHAPRVHSLADQMEGNLADARRHDPEGKERETIGERLRTKYERAVRVAGETLAKGVSTRGDRHELVRIITEERFMVPEPSDRRALRQIARDTKSSYARVAACDRHLAEAVRRLLRADPEFAELKRHGHEAPEGMERAIDAEIERSLVARSTEAFLGRLGEAEKTQRWQMLGALVEVSGDDIEKFVRSRFALLPGEEREALLRRCLSEDSDSRAKRLPRCRASRPAGKPVPHAGLESPGPQARPT
jgi:hypothetical protein